MDFFRNKKLQPILISVAFFCGFIFIILKYTTFYNSNKEKDIRGKLLEVLVSQKAKIEKALNSRIYYTKGIAAYISINPNITDDIFHSLADELIQKDSVINTMSISKDCVINAIYPMKGHESAVGLDLLLHPQRKKIVERTIETHNTFIAGPVELVEGGVAFISYTPIFSRGKDDTSKFWGMTDIVILKDKLFNELNFTPEDENYKYALRGIDGTGIDGICFFGDSTIYNSDPEIVDILLPTGSWSLASIPVDGWESYLNKTEIITIILYISAFFISILIWLLAKAMIKIRENEKELKALFGSMQDLVIVFNRKGEYVRIAPTNESLLVLPKDKITGKTLHEVFDKPKADFFLDAINKCLDTKEVLTIDYPLKIDSKDLWFQARLSCINDDEAIYIAHDNTQKRKAEEELINSEKALKELNVTKDKLFSIIAHDLRSPFAASLGLAELLKEDFDILEPEEVKEYITQISNTLKIQYGLLENLLHWAQMQTNKMEFIRKRINISEKVEDIIKVIRANAKRKNIEIRNEISADVFLNVDINMFSSIINNLVSNAIKFTREGGTISLSGICINDTYQITVKDTGIGMKQEDTANIFGIDKKHTTFGTNGEKGTGLGLALVKEMVEKHNGRIRVESELNIGSSFIFTLPTE